MPLLNVFSIIGTYSYAKCLRIVFINTVVSNPGKHELNFQLHKFNENVRLTWAEEIRGLIEEKGLMEEDWNDRDKWKKIM